MIMIMAPPIGHGPPCCKHNSCGEAILQGTCTGWSVAANARQQRDIKTPESRGMPAQVGHDWGPCSVQVALDMGCWCS